MAADISEEPAASIFRVEVEVEDATSSEMLVNTNSIAVQCGRWVEGI
jgi:hypothetical protein